MMHRMLRLCILLALVCTFQSFRPLSAQTPPPPVFLWPNGAPGALGNAEVDKPRMYIFLPEKRSTSAAILVIPGGGYQGVALGFEGFQAAQWLNQQGMPAFVLDYRVRPYHYPVEIDDGRRAMRLIRAHAAEYGIDPNRLGVWGFSAGGHLASSLGTHCENVTVADTKSATPMSATSVSVSASSKNDPIDPIEQLSCKPDFMVLAYPVIAMEQSFAHSGSRRNLFGPNPDPEILHEYSNQLAVTEDTPPAFIFATTNDPVVPVENSLDFYRALERAHVHAELHIFDYSNHGCGLCGSILPLRVWPALLRTWLIDRSFLPIDAPPLPAPEPNWPAWPKGFTGPGEF
jgi:acetyl esterase/lipase